MTVRYRGLKLMSGSSVYPVLEIVGDWMEEQNGPLPDHVELLHRLRGAGFCFCTVVHGCVACNGGNMPRNEFENDEPYEEWESIMIGERTDFQEKAKQIVTDYVDSLFAQNNPGAIRPEYTVYVVWFAKTLQNWKAILGTTMSDGMLFELTHDGDRKVTYLDAYKKQDNVPIHDRS